MTSPKWVYARSVVCPFNGNKCVFLDPVFNQRDPRSPKQGGTNAISWRKEALPEIDLTFDEETKGRGIPGSQIQG